MPDPAPNPHFSAQLQQRYRLRMDPWLVDWIDGPVCRLVGQQQFHVPVDPSELLAPTPDCVWPVLMPCDFLPVLGNNAGDYLCLRFGSDNQVREIVHWYHGGGDWIPWGKTLPDAIIFDLVSSRLPGARKDHAIAAEDPRPQPTSDFAEGSDPIVQWACQFMPADVQAIVSEATEISDPLVCEETANHWLERLESHQIATEAVGLRRVQDLMARPNPDLYWSAVRTIADRLISIRNDLAWVMNVAGDAAMHQGEPQLAAGYFRSALRSSDYTDQSVRLGMEWDSKDSLKYAADRLRKIEHDSADAMVDLYQGNESGDGSVAQRVSDFWMQQSFDQEKLGDLDQAIESAIASGWDVGLESLHAYEPILHRVIELSEKAGQFARAELSKTHLASFQQRYG